MKDNIFLCHNCPMTRTMASIGSKWKPIIIYSIGLNTRRFGEIFARIEIISKKVLASQLKELVEDEILSRREYNDRLKHVDYTLTEKGVELLKILNQLTLWNAKFNENTI